MNESSIPVYILPNDQRFPLSHIVALTTNLIAIIPNLYFVIRTITYKPFKNRINFYRMTLVMSIEYTIGCASHFLFSVYYITYYIQEKPYYLDTCSKLEILDFNTRFIITVTPLYFTISRFYATVKQKSVNTTILIATICITIVPISFNTICRIFEIRKYYIPYVICEYEIMSDIPLFGTFRLFTHSQVIFVPFITLGINYIIYLSIKKKKLKSNSITSNKENKTLFKSLTIQVFFPHLCEFPGFIYYFYYISTLNAVPIFEATVVFIYHIGQGFAVFLSLYIIKEFKIMMLKDFGLEKNKTFVIPPIKLKKCTT